MKKQRGGELVGQDSPSLEFEPIPAHVTVDITPLGGDGIVDYLDLATWLLNQSQTAKLTSLIFASSLSTGSKPHNLDHLQNLTFYSLLDKLI